MLRTSADVARLEHELKVVGATVWSRLRAEKEKETSLESSGYDVIRELFQAKYTVDDVRG